jgi:hypothetical protein
MGKKIKKLNCFDIKTIDERLTKTVNVFAEIKKSLENRKTVDNRYRKLAEADEAGEGEFIANYKIINDEMLMACFIAMKQGIAPEIKKTFFEKESFSLSELETKDKRDVEGHIKDHTHFLLTKDFLILKSSQGITNRTISTYLNWLLLNEKEYAGKAGVFTLPVHLRKTIDVNNISAFAIGDNFKIKKDDLVEQTFSASQEILSNIFSVANLSVDPARIFDAYITFKIRKFPKEDEDEKVTVVQKILETIRDDNCDILDRRGQVIDVSSIKAQKEISITHTASGFPDETELEKEMILYLQEITNEKNNCAV